ncbi:MAG: VTT domain-containing protein [bacterium]|nr:VTT domain-containing protein [bacterium]
MHELFGYLDPTFLISTVGYLGFAGIIFAECGLFFGFFLPGDSLLFTAGFLASQDVVNIWAIVGIAVTGNVAGNAVGYAFGYRVGRRIFQREDSLLFKKKYLLEAEKFYNKHGAKTIVLACFMPIIRTFAPIVAGVGNMKYSTFFTYNVIGALLWGAGVPAIGYWLGSTIPGVDKYLLPIIAVIIVLSILPGVYHFLKEYMAHKKNPTGELPLE